jgi:hypothetical protein
MSRVDNLCLQLPKLECFFPSPQLPPCTSFTLFPNLPRELRNKVWELAAHVSQDIDLSNKKNPPRSYHPPAIMYTSREAREEGSRYYTRCRDVAHIWTPSFLNPHMAGILCINFAVDRFVFPSESFPLNYGEVRELFFDFDGPLFERIQHLAIPANHISDSELKRGFLELFDFLLEMKSQSSIPFDISVMRKVTRKHGASESTEMSRELGESLAIRNAVANFENEYGKKLPIAW